MMQTAHLPISRPADYRAALYIRLSKEDENEGPSESVSNQKSMLEAFAQQQGLAVYSTYIDDGWSGTNFDRPAFNRMIADIEAGRVNMVITKDLSRLGRDYIMTGHYMERYFPEKQVRYISLLDGIDTGVESSANEITPFRAIMNDLYAKDISKKIRSVKHDKQRKGEFIGGKPVFGYRMHPTEKNKIVIDEGAAPTVKRIFGMALDGLSCRQIAALLNAEGVPTPAAYAGLTVAKPGPYSGKWSAERIADMLKNETYIGSMVQGKSVKVSYKSKKSRRQDRNDWVVVPGTHAPIIDGDTFRHVQRLLESRRHTRTRTYDFLLKGMIFCHECGHPLAVVNRRNAAGEDVLYFVCRTYQRFTKDSACTCHAIKEQTVTAAVIGAVRELCAAHISPARLTAIAESVCRESRAAADRDADTAALRERIAGLTASLDRVYLDRLGGVLTEADFARIYPRLKAERTALEGKLSDPKARNAIPAQEALSAEALTAQFLDAAFSTRALLTELIERVELTEDRQIIIQFRFGPPEPRA